MPMTPCLSQKPVKTGVAMDMYLGYECWKHQYLWRENVDVMMSQCPQKTRKSICEYLRVFQVIGQSKYV